MGPAWRIGRQYKPKAAESKYQCDIVERSAQPALTIRTRISPIALAPTIGASMLAVLQHAGEKGNTPTGPPFVAYHGFDGQEQDIEIGFPFEPGIEGKDNIKVSEIPGGKSAIYHHVGPYENLPQVRAALEQWLNTNGHAISGATYEIYLNDPQTTAPENLETEIVYPLLSGN
jgi:effector-binding domain-containing protein